MRTPLSLLAMAALSSFGPVTQAAEPPATPYHLIQEIKIGGEGGWDYLAVDGTSRRLFVTHGTQVEVIDLDKNAVTGAIKDTPGVHGVAFAPRLDLGFISDGGEAKATVFDLKTLAVRSKIATGEGPDAILFAQSRNEVYTFNGRAHSATVFDAQSGKVLATIALPGKPEFAVEDAAAGRIYNNIEDKNAVVVIDARTHAVLNTWPAAPCESASGMAIDISHHRLFLGCDNQMMVMMDSTSGKVITTVPIGEGVDANAFDPGTQLAFSSNGSGTVTIAHEESPTSLKIVQTLQTTKGARTMALDPLTHRIYLAVAERKESPKNAEGVPQRPAVIPDTFRVLVYGMD